MANYENVTEVFVWDKKIATLLDTAGNSIFNLQTKLHLLFHL